MLDTSDEGDMGASPQAFESQGRTWPRETSLATAGVQAGDFIALFQRLRGGGGDGGSTGAESRSSFLEMYATKKAAKVWSAALMFQAICSVRNRPQLSAPVRRVTVLGDDLRQH